MFYCDFCKSVTRSGESMTLVTTAVRQKTYRSSYRPSREELESLDYEPRAEESAGTEIVHQSKACQRCASSHKNTVPKVIVEQRTNNVVWESKSDKIRIDNRRK